MKKIAGSLRLDLAAFRELEAFAQLGTELDKATQAQLDRGYRMVELLKQPQFGPLHVADQVVAIYAGAKGYFDKVPVAKVAGNGSVSCTSSSAPSMLICETSWLRKRHLTDEIEGMLKKALEAFVARLSAKASEFRGL
jgi:F-type H+-transporting ATPase subunit alpha